VRCGKKKKGGKEKRGGAPEPISDPLNGAVGRRGKKGGGRKKERRNGISAFPEKINSAWEKKKEEGKKEGKGVKRKGLSKIPNLLAPHHRKRRKKKKKKKEKGFFFPKHTCAIPVVAPPKKKKKGKGEREVGKDSEKSSNRTLTK